MAQNKVIAGDYEGKNIMISQKGFFSKQGVFLFTGFTEKFPLNKETLTSYELITEEHRKSAVSGVSRGLVGGVLLGPVGLLAGLSAKNKGTHTIAVEFKDGKKSLIEVDEKIYKMFIQQMF
ncbi:hypothetical protein [Bacillus ndiopicus]|uniref:hypothetical protein n=1 Tax=Bacillus ndiopicus TaxID=1347368 RepID=UPI0005A766C7|nr:hypothetical protein [Bacillus ndiopicus]